MIEDPLLEKKQFFADIIFKNLVGLTRAEDVSLNFYSMKLNAQNATEEGFKRFAFIVSNFFIDSYSERINELKRKGKSMSGAEKENLITVSLKKGWEIYNGHKKR